MLLFVVVPLLALISLAIADDPPKCCTDRQFQAVIGRIGGMVYPLTGNTVFIDGYDEAAFDFYRKRQGVRSHQRQPDGSMKTVSYLRDYVNKRQYISKDGKCMITTLDGDMTSNCIPANATFLGTSTLGYGTQGFSINTWEFVENQMVVKLGVTASGCVPVILAYYGTPEGATTDAVEIFSSFKPGIDNPSDLDLPNSSMGCVFVDVDKDGDKATGKDKATVAPVVG